MKLSTTTKVLLTMLFFGGAVLGFMIKLPSVFRHSDKLMHSLFYFLAAAFLNVLFVKRNIIKHAVVFAFLYCFGMAIELAQEYSNKLLRRRIHGRFDPEDLEANLKGLLAFSVLWIVWVTGVFFYRSLNRENPDLS